MFVGVVGLTGIAGVFVAWRQFDQRRAPGVEPDAKAASTGGRQQIRGDRRPNVGERRAVGGSCQPPVARRFAKRKGLRAW